MTALAADVTAYCRSYCFYAAAAEDSAAAAAEKDAAEAASLSNKLNFKGKRSACPFYLVKESKTKGLRIINIPKPTIIQPAKTNCRL